MAGSVFLDDFQQKHLVVGDRKLGQREYRPLALVPLTTAGSLHGSTSGKRPISPIRWTGTGSSPCSRSLFRSKTAVAVRFRRLFHVRPEYWCGSVPYRLGKLPRIPDLCRANEKNGFPTMSVRLCEILNYGDVMLEPGADHRRFTLWRPLAVCHRYCRLAKRSKFQDYRVNLTYAEMRKIG